ncbi:unnamed protein product [Prunus armeniaca]|uniref:Uncharacterized protein n=1 Tax=Prunus armeniaca TaxID=36596 RepID=A0A6J5W133_PRUAR|nr:unnamed protein product [Prunus armeniaca]
MLLVNEACDAVAFIKSPVTPAAAIDFFVLCTFTASSSDSAAFVPPSTPLPSQPTLTPTAMAASPPRILIDSFYAELNANGYKFAELEHPPEAKPEHPPKVAAAPSKAGAAINLKILIKGKDLNTAIAKDVTATLNAPKAPKALKAALMKLKILMNDKDIALAMTEVVEAAAAATATVPTSRLRKPLFPVNVDLEVESFTDLLKEMYNEVVASAILKSSPTSLALHPQSTGPLLPPMNCKDIVLAMTEAAKVVTAAIAAVSTPRFRKSMLPVDVDPEVESAVDLLKEMYNKVKKRKRKKEKEELMLLVKEVCDAIAFIESPATPVAAIDFFVLCIFMASSSDSAASVPPSTPQPTGHLLPPQSTGPSLPSQPTFASKVVAASPPRILINSFYAELNAKTYKFAELEHPLEAETEHPLEKTLPQPSEPTMPPKPPKPLKPSKSHP